MKIEDVYTLSKRWTFCPPLSFVIFSKEHFFEALQKGIYNLVYTGFLSYVPERYYFFNNYSCKIYNII